MRYLLTVLTNGRPCFPRAVAAFLELARPGPSDVYVFDDGLTTPPEAFAAVGDAVVEGASLGVGQCAAQAHCWEAAAESDLDWCFHLEDDMVLLCPIDLHGLAKVLDAEPYLAQMALVRTPAGAEVEHGGFIPAAPGWYERCYRDLGVPGGYRWIAQARNWINAPALFRTSLARAVPWPAEPGCETAVGPRILALDEYRAFGLWGGGECQVGHVGVERAPGARSY